MTTSTPPTSHYVVAKKVHLKIKRTTYVHFRYRSKRKILVIILIVIMLIAGILNKHK